MVCEMETERYVRLQSILRFLDRALKELWIDVLGSDYKHEIEPVDVRSKLTSGYECLRFSSCLALDRKSTSDVEAADR